MPSPLCSEGISFFIGKKKKKDFAFSPLEVPSMHSELALFSYLQISNVIYWQNYIYIILFHTS